MSRLPGAADSRPRFCKTLGKLLDLSRPCLPQPPGVPVTIQPDRPGEPAAGAELKPRVPLARRRLGQTPSPLECRAEPCRWVQSKGLARGLLHRLLMTLRGSADPCGPRPHTHCSPSPRHLCWAVSK